MTGDASGVPLSDGKVATAGVVRHGSVVRRHIGPGAASIHQLLGHLGALGVPQPTELHDDHEVLTFVEGTTVRLPWAAWIADERLLVRAAASLRAIHDATASLLRVLPSDGWWWWSDDPSHRPAEVIRHGDPWPPNLVVRDDDLAQPVAWIDWDFAQPGLRIDDLAAFAKHWAPLMSDERALRHGWPVVPDRPGRLRMLADAYGLDADGRAELVDAAIRFANVTGAAHRRWAAAGMRPFAVMLARGVTEMIESDGEWLAAQRADFDAALR